MIYLLDDFHNIHSVWLPGDNMKLSLATHMLDIYQDVPAIPFPCDRKKIHRIVTFNWKGAPKTCRGGIDTVYISQMEHDQQAQHQSTFLSTLKEELRKLN